MADVTPENFNSLDDFELEIGAGNQIGPVNVQITNSNGSGTGTFQVLSPNEAPTDILLSNNTLHDNQPNGFVVGTLSTVDIDVGDTHTYTLVSDPSGVFYIDGDELKVFDNNNLSYVASPYTLRIQTEDSFNETFEKDFDITVTRFNHAPADILLTNSDVTHNAGQGTKVGDLITSDLNLPDDSHTYQLIDSANGAFSLINGGIYYNDEDQFNIWDTLKTITVRSTDAFGATIDVDLDITILEGNEPPVDIYLSNNEIYDNVSDNHIIGTFASSDPNAADDHFYTIVEDNSGFFSIVGDDLVITDASNLDYNISHPILVETSDLGGLSYVKSFLVIVNRFNYQPTDIELSNNIVDHNAVQFGEIGTLTTEDLNSPDETFTYTLLFNPNNYFGIVGDKLVKAVDYDLDLNNPNLMINIRSEDSVGAFRTEFFNITVVEGAIAPDSLSLSNDTISYLSPDNTFIGDLTSTDGSSSDSWTYYITDDSSGAFQVVGTQLYLQTANLVDYYESPTYPIDITVEDSTGLTYTETFIIKLDRYVNDNSWTSNLQVCENQFFNPLSSAYDGERELYKMVHMEAYNMFGTEMEYFVVDFNKMKDPLFGEDTNQAIIRSFDFSGYTKLTQELENQTMYGLWGNDDLQFEVSQIHFAEASKLHYESYIDDPDREERRYDPTQYYEEMNPRIGDLFKFKFSDRYYEITDIRQSKNQFRLDQHNWTFFARVYIEKNYQVESVVFEQVGNQGPQGNQTIWEPARDEHDNLIIGNQGPQTPQGYQGAITQPGNQAIPVEFDGADIDILEINDEIVNDPYDNIDDVIDDDFLDNW